MHPTLIYLYSTISTKLDSRTEISRIRREGEENVRKGPALGVRLSEERNGKPHVRT